MRSKFFTANKAWIAVLMIITFASSPVWAQARAYPTQKLEGPSATSSVAVIVEHARRADVAELTASYQEHTTATVVPIVLTQEEALQMGLTDNPVPSVMSEADIDRYSQREFAVPHLAQYEGGDLVVVLSLSGLLLLILVVVLVVILID